MELFPGWEIPVSWTLLLLACLLFYIYTTWPFAQFQKLGISGPPPQLFFGNQRQLFSKGSVYIFREWAKQYGRVYGIYLGRQPMIVISDLDIVKAVLVKEFAHFTDRYTMNRSAVQKPFRSSVSMVTGADWKRIRSIISPTFTSGKLRMMEPQINRCSEDLTANLLELALQGKKLDVKEYFGAYTMDVIASTVFGLQVNSQKDLSDPFILNIKAMLGFRAVTKFQVINMLLAVMPWMSPVVRWVRHLRVFSQGRAFYMDRIQDMIQQRKAAHSEHMKSVDFLQLLINAEATDNMTGVNKRLNMEEIEAQMLIFFFAGYETTGKTLQNLAYELAKHPDVQQRLVDEIEQHLGQETPTYDNTAKLKYLDCAIHEILRLYPPITMVTRVAAETVTVQDLTIPKGFGVLVPVSEVMRDPEYFPQPNVFDPDRFSDKDGMDPASFLAFGLGPRICVGLRLALLEIKIAMVHVLRRIKFVRTPDLLEELHFQPGLMGLDRIAPVMVKVEPRHGDQ